METSKIGLSAGVCMSLAAAGIVGMWVFGIYFDNVKYAGYSIATGGVFACISLVLLYLNHCQKVAHGEAEENIVDGILALIAWPFNALYNCLHRY